jgi:hypothetical protein
LVSNQQELKEEEETVKESHGENYKEEEAVNRVNLSRYLKYGKDKLIM